MTKYVGGYTVEMFETEAVRPFGLWYRKLTMEVYFGEELVLSLGKLDEEEFLNYLVFLVPRDVFEGIKAILMDGYDNNDEDEYLDEYDRENDIILHYDRNDYFD